MHTSHRPTTGQQQRVRHYASNSDSYAMLNLLTVPQLLDRENWGQTRITNDTTPSKGQTKEMLGIIRV